MAYISFEQQTMRLLLYYLVQYFKTNLLLLTLRLRFFGRYITA